MISLPKPDQPEEDFDQQLLEWLKANCDCEMVEQLAELVGELEVEN